MIQSEQECVYLNNKQAGLGAAVQSSTFISPIELLPAASIAQPAGCCRTESRSGRAAGQCSPLKSPSSLEGSDTAFEMQIKTAASKETTLREKGAFKGRWARGQRESIFYHFLLPILLGSPCPGHAVSEGNVCCHWSCQSRRARDATQGQRHMRG